MKNKLQEKQYSQSYYEILEVPPDSSQEEIHLAYQRVKNTYVIDNIALHSIMTKRECTAILEMAEEAYSILGEPSKRKAYDKAKGFSPKEEKDDLKDFTNNKTNCSQTLLDTKLTTQPRTTIIADFRDTPPSHSEASVSKVAALNRFSLDYKLDPKMEKKIESCQLFTGTFLKEIRTYKGVDLPRMNNITKVSKTYLKNIEEENLENLPALTYVRGFVYQYAKTLKLNPDHVANSYISRFRKNI